MARPTLTLVRNGNVRQSAAQFAAENLRFRTMVAGVTVPHDDEGVDASCERLSDLCRSVNSAVRTLDLERDQTVGDLCFATRVRIAEVARILFSRRTARGLREARRALHASLAFLLQTLPPVLEPSRSRSGVPMRQPLDDLATVLSAALRADPLDTDFLLELTEVELILAASSSDFASLGRATTGRLLELQRAITAWDESGRASSVTKKLAQSLLLVLDGAVRQSAGRGAGDDTAPEIERPARLLTRVGPAKLR